MWKRLLLLALASTLLSTNACRCQDRSADAWPLGADAGADTGDASAVDTAVDTLDGDDAADTGVDALDASEVSDVRDADIVDWERENVVSEVTCREVLNDRTSLVVDESGTEWIGFHQFQSPDCEESNLVVARHPVGGRWEIEAIADHRGIFGLAIIDAGEPLVVYPDADRGEFRAAKRRSAEDWRLHTFDLEGLEVDRGDGFDVTSDDSRFYATFAADGSRRVRLFSHSEGADISDWRSRRSLRADDPRAAMARGLRADTGDSVYLVHRNEEIGRGGQFGIARYDKEDDRWPNRAYLGRPNRAARVHSFALTDAFELCMSSRLEGNLLVTCGTMADLDRDRKLFTDETVSRRYPSSIVEGEDGTLYVAFSPEDNSELRVAIRSPEGDWSVQRVFASSTFGISTSIDPNGDLVLAFYTCQGEGCSLKVVRERPDTLK